MKMLAILHKNCHYILTRNLKTGYHANCFIDIDGICLIIGNSFIRSLFVFLLICNMCNCVWVSVGLLVGCHKCHILTASQEKDLIVIIVTRPPVTIFIFFKNPLILRISPIIVSI